MLLPSHCREVKIERHKREARRENRGIQPINVNSNVSDPRKEIMLGDHKLGGDNSHLGRRERKQKTEWHFKCHKKVIYRD